MALKSSLTQISQHQKHIISIHLPASPLLQLSLLTIAYLSHQLQQVSQVESRRRLRSSSTSSLVIPATRRSTLGDRAFPASAARACKQSAVNRHHCSNFVLRRALKTHFFTVSFPSWRTICRGSRLGSSMTVLGDLAVFWTLRHLNLFFYTIRYDTPFPSDNYPPFSVFMCTSFISWSTTFSVLSWAYLFFWLPNHQSSTLFTQSSSSFLRTCLYHHNPFLCTAFTMSSITNHCLDSTQYSLSLSFTPYIHLIILI